MIEKIRTGDATTRSRAAATKTRDFAEAQKNAAAESIQDMAQEAKDTARGFEDRAPGVAEFTQRAAHQVERMSEGLRSTSIDELVDGLVRATKQQPIGVVAGAFFVGILLSRLMMPRAHH